MKRLAVIGLAVCAALSGDLASASGENWLMIGGGGKGVERMTFEIDLNSAKLQPNGVTTYKWRIISVNPFTLKEFPIDMADGIDCKTLEVVSPKTGARTEKITRQMILDQSNNSPAVVAFRNFCHQQSK